MAYLPTDIANQALDAAGVDFTLGDLEEGSRPAQVCLRAYEQCLKQLLRGAPWDFARRESPLELLADGSGATPNVGSVVPNGQFQYEYAYPEQCARIRYIPWSPFQNPGPPPANIQVQNPSVPVNTGGQPPSFTNRPRPARFLITNDTNYPPPAGQIFWEVQGQSPTGRLVILTNVLNATCVFTVMVMYPSMWDALFRAAMVAYLASELCIPLNKDKKLGLQLQTQNINLTKSKIAEARVADGNEMFTSSDIRVDWMENRYVGRGHGWSDSGGWGGLGCWGGGGWGGSIGFGDGSSY